MDAAEFIKAHPNEFDVVIVDSSDPVGPAESLYTSEFYANMKAGLREGGIICTQGECQWLHLDLIRRVLGDAKALFGNASYCYTTTPTYPSGQIGFIVACLDGSGAYPRALPVSKCSVVRVCVRVLECHSLGVAAADDIFLPPFLSATLNDWYDIHQALVY